jgi:hypothetical protein
MTEWSTGPSQGYMKHASPTPHYGRIEGMNEE